MSNKIQPTDRFSVERGTDDELRRTLEIFERNGIKPHDYYDPSNYKLVSYPLSNTTAYPESYTKYIAGNDEPRIGDIHYTPSEFHAKYGSRVYPFDLVGDAIQHDGKWWKRVSSEKGWIDEDGIQCIASSSDIADLQYTRRHLLFAIHPKKCASSYPFVCDGNIHNYAWVEVDPPEPQVETISVAEAEKRFGIKIVVEVAK